MAQATCSVDGCDRAAKKRGWCVRHYKRWERHGEPTAGRINEHPPYAGAACSIDGCDRRATKRLMCDTHYRRWHTFDDPRASVPIRPGPANPPKPRKPGFAPIDSHDAAWLAGLFEGEGTIIIRDGKYVRLVIGMTDRDVIERVDALVPMPNGPRFKKKERERWKDQYVWYVQRVPIVNEVLKVLLPWLGERRRMKALEALYVLEHCHPGMAAHHHRAKTHCPQGHPYDEENTYVYRGGRSCKICIRERARRWEREHRERRLELRQARAARLREGTA